VASTLLVVAVATVGLVHPVAASPRPADPPPKSVAPGDDAQAAAIPPNAAVPICTQGPLSAEPSHSTSVGAFSWRRDSVWRDQISRRGCLEQGDVFYPDRWTPPTSGRYFAEQLRVTPAQPIVDNEALRAGAQTVSFSYEWLGGERTDKFSSVEPYSPGRGFIGSWGLSEHAVRYRNANGSWGAWQFNTAPIRFDRVGTCSERARWQAGGYSLQTGGTVGTPTCTFTLRTTNPTSAVLDRDFQVALTSSWSALAAVVDGRLNPPAPDGTFFASWEIAWGRSVTTLYFDAPEAAPPTASFTATPVDGQPGTFDYASTSTDPRGLALTHRWTFADGTTATTPSVRRSYATPGDFIVSLQVTNSADLSATTAQLTTVAAPRLELDIGVAGADDGLDPGTEATVTVRVAASADGVGDLTGLEFPDDGLVTGDGRVIEIVDAPALPAGPFTLTPGQSRTFSGKVRAGASGSTSLTTSVTGVDAAGRPVRTDAERPVRVRSEALDLELTLDRPELTLEEDASGPTPETVELTVTGTNITDDDLTDIRLLSIIPSWQEGLPFTASFPSSILQPKDGPGSDGLSIGSLGPGEEFERTFEVVVNDDGHLRLGTSATFRLPGGTGSLTTGEVDLLSKPKYLLTFEAEADASVDDNPADPWNPPDAVAAGRSFLVTGSLKNLTTDQRIVATIPAVGLDQVSSVNLGKLEEDWDNPSLPFRVEIDPGSSQGVKASPIAIPVPGKDGVLTFARAAYEPTGKALLREADELTTIAPDQIRSPLEDRSFSVPIVWPPPIPGPTAIEFFGLYSKAFIESTAAWWANAGASAGRALYAIGEMEANAWAVITDPVERERLRQQLTGAWASFVNNADLMRATIQSLSPQQRALLIAEITNPFLLYLRAGRSIVTSEQAQAAAEAIGNAVAGAWDRITTLGGEDPRELARILGSGSATVFNEVTVGMVTDAALAKLFTQLRYGDNLAQAQKFVDDAAAAKAAEGLRIDKGLKGIPAGAVLTDEVLTVGLGITRAEKDQMLAVAKRFNINVMARSRGAGAAELVTAGRARLKPFGVDAKNVSDLDVLLGFPASMKDTVAIRKPNAWADVVASPQYQVLDAEQRAQVAARWQTRSKEWNGGGKLQETAPGQWEVAEAPPDAVGAERKKFLEAAERGTFDLQFPTAGNWEEVAVESKALATARTEFGLRRVTDDAGFEVIQPYMGDGKGKGLLPITGDVDLVALLNPDGTYPDPAKVIAAYAELAKPPLRMQHPATWSFDIKGKSMDLLADHVLGGPTAEPLAAFGPTGKITAVLFDPKMSLIPADRKANPALLLKVSGGIKLPSSAYGLGAALPVFLEQDARAANSYYVPEQWDAARSREGSSPTRRTATTAGVRFERTAAPVEEQDNFSLSRFSGGAWQPWTLPASGPLPIAPQTAITAALEQGTTTVSIYTLDQLFERTGSGGQAWFQEGDTVTVDLGGAQPWTTTLARVGPGSVTFAEPAPQSYLPGTAMHLRTTAVDEPGEDDGSGGAPTTPPSTPSTPTTEPPGVGEGELARTGWEGRSLAWLGALAILAGAALLGLRRTRRLVGS
jgi:hypothetical protein